MGWFSSKSEAERAADQIELQRGGAAIESAMAKGARAVGANKTAAKWERNAERDRQVADEIEGDGRVRGWW